jgi:short-subunit dehydrogenase
MKPFARHLRDRVVVITGASSGIGKALAEQLSQGGDRVYALARSLPDTLAEPAARPAGSYATARVDVTDAPAVQHVIDRIVAREARIDILVLAAGSGLAGAVEDTAPDEAEWQIKINYLGSAFCLPPVLAQMRAQRSGLIVQLGSVAGFMPIPFQAHYSASKAALAALIRALANEVRPWGVRCLLVQPGDTRTGFTRSRIMSRASAGSDYASRCSRSVARMAKDEMNGMSAERMAGLIRRRISRRRIPLVYTPGLFYQAIGLIQRFLPAGLINRALYALYGR